MWRWVLFAWLFVNSKWPRFIFINDARSSVSCHSLHMCAFYSPIDWWFWHLFVNIQPVMVDGAKCKSSYQLFYFIGFIIKFAPHTRRNGRFSSARVCVFAAFSADKLFRSKFEWWKCIVRCVLGCCIIKQMLDNLTLCAFSRNQIQWSPVRCDFIMEPVSKTFDDFEIKFNKLSRVMITIMIMCFGFDRNTRVHTQMHTLNKQKSKYQIPYVEWWSNHKMHKFGYYTRNMGFAV